MYGDTTGIEEGAPSEFLSYGVHEVFIESLTLIQTKTANYEGPVADLVLSNGRLRNEHRIFPFRYNPEFKDFNTGVHTLEPKQIEDYKTKHMHLFNKAVGEEEYKSLIAGVDSFEDYIQKLASKVTKLNGGKGFKVLLKDKNGFPVYPMWKGGSAESLDSNNIEFDPIAHGPKQKKESEIEGPDGDNPGGKKKDGLPF